MTELSALAELIADGKQIASRPWPRAVVGRDAWVFATDRLADGSWTLLALWAEPRMVHLALRDQETTIGVLSLEARDGRFPSVGLAHPPARRLERAIKDLYGLQPEGAPDERPWLDHGKWMRRHPLGVTSANSAAEPYRFLPVEGESLHQIPVGPVHAGIIEPGHFRFTASGETIVRLEERLGYVHKGIEGLMAGAPLDRATKLAARVSGDSTVGYSMAFAEAVEAALELVVPRRALWLRALMLELERIANHFGDIGAVCNDAAFSMMHAHCGVLRERTLRAAHDAFGHRLMMDCVIAGGVAADMNEAGRRQIQRCVSEARRRFPALVRLYENTASLQDRTVGTGVASPAFVWQFGAGGFIGRASGRNFDARRFLARPPYNRLRFDVPVLEQGDVDARLQIRMREVEQSLLMIETLLETMPPGESRVSIPSRAGEGLSLVEGFRGDIFIWLRLSADGTLARAHLRDPSWFQWPLLEAAIEGNIVADFPLCNKSFNCSYAGHDL
jgi:Ni,Fe-hydrogenase III large subunit